MAERDKQQYSSVGQTWSVTWNVLQEILVIFTLLHAAALPNPVKGMPLFTESDWASSSSWYMLKASTWGPINKIFHFKQNECWHMTVVQWYLKKGTWSILFQYSIIKKATFQVKQVSYLIFIVAWRKEGIIGLNIWKVYLLLDVGAQMRLRELYVSVPYLSSFVMVPFSCRLSLSPHGSQKAIRNSRPIPYHVNDPPTTHPKREPFILEGRTDSDQTTQHISTTTLAIVVVIVSEVL